MAKAAMISQLVKKRITNEQCVVLQQAVIEDEIQNTLFAIKKNKAPESKGFPTDFYKKAWCVVGGDVVPAIQDFFSSSKLLNQTNAAIITLVPKKVNPSRMGDFWPISCCNLIYKCITKILANCLVPCLDAIINPKQTDFVPSRSIA